MSSLIKNKKTYRIALKDTVEQFTKKLFYALFLGETEQIKELYVIEEQYDELTRELKIKDAGNIWDE